MNFGMEGYGTAQEILTFRHHVQQYRPDVVVLQFFAANDVRNNSKALEGDQARPYFQFDGERLRLDTSFRDYNGAWWRRWGLGLAYRSRLAQLAYVTLRRFRAWSRIRESDSVAGSTDGKGLLPLNAGLDEQIYREPGNPAWSDAWRVTEALIAQFHQETTAIGSRFLVMVVPHAVEFHPNPMVRAEFAKRVGVKDLSYPDSRLRDIAQRLGFPALILSKELGRYSLVTGQALCGFANTRLGWGHFNAEGHRIAGKLLATAIADLSPEVR
jgi:hypothetical protein